MQKNGKDQNNPSEKVAVIAKSEVTAAEEKSILAALKMESSSFVPDKLDSIMKEAGVKASTVSAHEEKKILSSIKSEANSFVPDGLLAVQQATGTVALPTDQESLAIHEKVKNEGAAFVKEAEPKVLKETGTKKRWSFAASFKAHKVSWIGGALLTGTAAAVAVGILLPNNTPTTTVNALAYVSVSVESASSYAKSSATSPAYDETATLSAASTANTYIPSFSFVANNKNLAKKDSLSADNYSATLVKAKIATISADISAPELIASKILPPSYDLGYLETKDKTLRNNITITIRSDDASFATNYQQSYQDAVNAYLNTNKIYADVTFATSTDTTASDYLSGLSEEKAQKVVKAYGFLSNNGVDDTNKDLFMKALAKEDDEALDGLIEAFNAVASTPLSEEALSSVHDGITLSYYRYITGYKLDTKETANRLKKAFVRHFQNIASLFPWSMPNPDDLDEFFDDDSYYINANAALEGKATTYAEGLADNMRNAGDVLSVYFRIRDLINASTNNANKFEDLMDSVTERVSRFAKDGNEGAFPDGDEHDHGGHDHGNGNQGDGWGDGGGDWDYDDDNWWEYDDDKSSASSKDND